MSLGYVEITKWIVVLAYVTLGGWYLWRSKKENPQDYISKHLLTIEMWIIAIFIMLAYDKITILLAFR